MGRGAVQHLFTWIFALVVGALIIVLAAKSLVGQQTAAQQRYGAQALYSIDAILAGHSPEDHSSFVINLPKATRLEFDAGQQALTANDVSRQLHGTYTIFMPSELSSARLYVYAFTVNVPFPAGQAVFISGRQIEDANGYSDALRKIRALYPSDSFAASESLLLRQAQDASARLGMRVAELDAGFPGTRCSATYAALTQDGNAFTVSSVDSDNQDLRNKNQVLLQDGCPSLY